MGFFGLKAKIPLRAVDGIGEEASEAAVRRGAGTIKKGKTGTNAQGKNSRKGKGTEKDNGKKEKPNRIEEQEQRLYM
jgi:hypothetical protein